MAERWKIAVAAAFWLVTTTWVAILGWHMGGLLALQSPETDRAPLLLLLAGPPVFALLQPLAAGRWRNTFLRTALLSATFLTPLVITAGSRLEAVPAWLVAAYALGCGLVGAAATYGAHLLRRLFRYPVAPRPLSLHGNFALTCTLSGLALTGISRLFLWRARVTRPEFDPMNYPNAYSRAMDWWTYGFLAVAGIATVALVWRAVRIISPGNINEA